MNSVKKTGHIDRDVGSICVLASHNFCYAKIFDGRVDVLATPNFPLVGPFGKLL